MKYWLCLLVLFLLCLEHFLLWKKGNTSKCTFLPSYTLRFYWKLPFDKIKSPLKVWAFSLFCYYYFLQYFWHEVVLCILPLSLVPFLITHGMNHNIEGFFCTFWTFLSLSVEILLYSIERMLMPPEVTT